MEALHARRSAQAALLRLGVPAPPPVKVQTAQAAKIRGWHCQFLASIVLIKGLLVSNPTYVRPLVRPGGRSMTSAGPSAPPSEHEYHALVPLSVHRTLDPTMKKGYRDDWRKHFAFAKEHVCFPDFQRRSGTSAPEDLLAAIDKSVELGPRAIQWRHHRQKLLKKESDKLHSLTTEIKRLAARPKDHQAVKAAPKAHIALLACLVEATGWPDDFLAYNMLHGFRVVGCLEDSGVFRPVLPSISEDAHFDLKASIALGNAKQISLVTTRLEAQARRAKFDSQAKDDLEQVFALSKKEWDGVGTPTMSKGFTKAQMDSKHGVGAWRPMLRFLVHQTLKDRVVDDAKQSRTNESARLVETVTLPSFEWAAIYAGHVARAAAAQNVDVPEMHLGLDDMSRAYRQIPARDQEYCVIGLWHPDLGKVLFHQVWGHPFGFTASVPNFSRLPVFLCTVARRLFACAVSSYVDDYMTPDLKCSDGSAQVALGTLHFCVGLSLELKKRLKSASVNVALGVEVDMSKAHSEGVVSFQIPTVKTELALASFEAHVAANRLTPAEASKLTGKLGWSLNGVFGRVGRAALGPTISRQHQTSPDYRITGLLRSSLHFFKELFRGGGPQKARRVPIFPSNDPPVLVWSDASADPNLMGELLTTLRSGLEPEASLRTASHGLGLAVVCPIHYPKGVWLQGKCPDEVLLGFSPEHKTLICQLESLMGVGAFFTYPELFRGRKVVHFIDNYSALYSFVKGSSGSTDMAALAHVLHLQLAELDCEVFWDWCPSGANIADLPSRPSPTHLRELYAAGLSADTRAMCFPSVEMLRSFGALLQRPATF